MLNLIFLSSFSSFFSFFSFFFLHFSSLSLFLFLSFFFLVFSFYFLSLLSPLLSLTLPYCCCSCTHLMTRACSHTTEWTPSLHKQSCLLGCLSCCKQPNQPHFLLVSTAPSCRYKYTQLPAAPQPRLEAEGEACCP